MLFLKILTKIHRKSLALILHSITLIIVVALSQMFQFRRKILQEKCICYNSLKAGHSVKNCTSQHCCFACKKNITFLFVDLRPYLHYTKKLSTPFHNPLPSNMNMCLIKTKDKKGNICLKDIVQCRRLQKLNFMTEI